MECKLYEVHFIVGWKMKIWYVLAHSKEEAKQTVREFEQEDYQTEGSYVEFTARQYPNKESCVICTNNVFWGD